MPKSGIFIKKDMWVTFIDPLKNRKYYVELEGSETWYEVILILNDLYQIPLTTKFTINNEKHKLKKNANSIVEYDSSFLDDTYDGYVKDLLDKISARKVSDSTEVILTIKEDDDSSSSFSNIAFNSKGETGKVKKEYHDPPDFSQLVEILSSAGFSNEDCENALREKQYDFNEAFQLLCCKGNNNRISATTEKQSHTELLRAIKTEYHDSMKEQYKNLKQNERLAVENLVNKYKAYSLFQCVDVFIACDKNTDSAEKLLKLGLN